VGPGVTSAWGKAWGVSWGAAWGRVTQPQDGPTGGLSWLRGYEPRHRYVITPTPREQDLRDELVLMLPLIS
jgi:hypothetical protein